MPKHVWQPYIDVRGPWPVYVNGNNAYELRMAPRTISVEEAEAFLRREGALK